MSEFRRLRSSSVFRRAGFGLAAVLLAGCTSTPAPQLARPVIAPLVPPKPIAPTAKPLPKPPADKPAAAAPSPAVLALLNDAESARAAGDLDGAAASLERGVRLQPRNALLWSRLAEIRLRQEQPQMAVDLAKKSSYLAGSDRALVQKNWALIAEAKQRLGDDAGAAEARRQAEAE